MAVFGYPVAPATPIAQGFHPGHDGVDFSVPVGTVIRAAAAGTVTQAGDTDPGGYGNEVDIDHAGGWSSRYAHLSSFGVGAGTQVAAGTAIGTSGGAAGAPGAGNSTGPHLHFELHTGGVPVDPTPYLVGIPSGRTATLTGFDPTDPLGIGGELGIPSPGDVLGGAGDAVLGPIRDLIAAVPAQFVKVLTGGHSITEIAIRSVELLGGTIVLAIGGVLFLKLATTGGETGRTVSAVRRAGAAPIRQGRRTIGTVRTQRAADTARAARAERAAQGPPRRREGAPRRPVPEAAP